MSRRSAAELEQLAKEVDAWADGLEPADIRQVPIGDLRAISSLVATIQEAETTLADDVDRARQEGRSWSQIGTALGFSKQTAQQRYG